LATEPFDDTAAAIRFGTPQLPPWPQGREPAGFELAFPMIAPIG
jgi:hypothetical protein